MKFNSAEEDVRHGLVAEVKAELTSLSQCLNGVSSGLLFYRCTLEKVKTMAALGCCVNRYHAMRRVFSPFPSPPSTIPE
jgi:hypothetical protein